MKRFLIALLLPAMSTVLVASCSNSTETTDPTGQQTGAGAGATSGAGGSGGSGAVCVGTTPPSDAYDADPGPLLAMGGMGGMGGAGGSMGGMGGMGGAGGSAPLGPTEIGSDAPLYQLTDFQPQSCGFDATYGLDQFVGSVTVAALLAGW